MLITKEELIQFTGVHKEEDHLLTEVYIASASEIINSYLGYDIEKYELNNNDLVERTSEIPGLVKLTCLRITALLQLEEDNNLGVNNKSFGDSGSRTFLNVVNFDKYLHLLNHLQRVRI